MPQASAHSLRARQLIKNDVEEGARRSKHEYVEQLQEEFPHLVLTGANLKSCVSEALVWLRKNGVDIPKEYTGALQTPQSEMAKRLIMADVPKVRSNNFYIKKLMDIFPELTRKKAQNCIEKAIVTLKKRGIKIKDRRYGNKGKNPLDRTLVIRRLIEEDLNNNLVRSNKVYISILIERYGIRVKPASIKYVIQKMRVEGVKIPSRCLPKSRCLKPKQSKTATQIKKEEVSRERAEQKRKKEASREKAAQKVAAQKKRGKASRKRAEQKRKKEASREKAAQKVAAQKKREEASRKKAEQKKAEQKIREEFFRRRAEQEKARQKRREEASRIEDNLIASTIMGLSARNNTERILKTSNEFRISWEEARILVAKAKKANPKTNQRT